MTGQHIPTGDSVTSVTTECQLYSNLMISDAASWLDTVGWEDRKKEDMESFKEMLRQYLIDNQTLFRSGGFKIDTRCSCVYVRGRVCSDLADG